MNIAALLREVDAKIERLLRAREIIQELASPAQPAAQKRRRKAEPLKLAVRPEPQLVVLPPKEKREYRRRIKPATEAPKALAFAPPSKPVFVPRAALPSPPQAGLRVPQLTQELLEAAVRYNLLGGAQA